MQHEITHRGSLLDMDGLMIEPGWARSELMTYNRGCIRASWLRKKEWDYYLFTDKNFAVAFTISDLGYLGMLSASFIDLERGTEHTETELVPFPRGKVFGLGTQVKDAHAECHTKRLTMKFENVSEVRGAEGEDMRPYTGLRRIRCNFEHFDGDKALKADLLIYEEELESMYIATPWREKPTAFYYNCKKNCLTCEGTVTYGDQTVTMKRQSSTGVLDWGRGVWTYDNTWYWGTGSGYLAGELFGFNLGYGFSDRSYASENCIYYKNKVHKLSEIEFVIPEDGQGHRLYTQPWDIRSDDDRFGGRFVPILDRKSLTDVKLIVSDQHQVFGRMTGYAVLDNGEKLEFKDFLCALEVVRNKY